MSVFSRILGRLRRRGDGDDSVVIRLAGDALGAAVAGDWDAVAAHVQRLDREFGSDGLQTALMVWCDTYIDHATDGDRNLGTPKVSFYSAAADSSDGPAEVDHVPASVRWAGRLIHARAVMDQTAWMAAGDALPDDGYEVGSYVMAVVSCVALTIKRLPRGYVRMGRFG